MGTTGKTLAEMFRLGEATIGCVVSGANYRHVPGWFTPEQRRERNKRMGVH